MNIIESLNKYSLGFFRWFYGDTAVSDMESYRRGKVFHEKVNLFGVGLYDYVTVVRILAYMGGLHESGCC